MQTCIRDLFHAYSVCILEKYNTTKYDHERNATMLALLFPCITTKYVWNTTIHGHIIHTHIDRCVLFSFLSVRWFQYLLKWQHRIQWKKPIDVTKTNFLYIVMDSIWWLCLDSRHNNEIVEETRDRSVLVLGLNNFAFIQYMYSRTLKNIISWSLVVLKCHTHTPARTNTHTYARAYIIKPLHFRFT